MQSENRISLYICTSKEKIKYLNNSHSTCHDKNATDHYHKYIWNTLANLIYLYHQTVNTRAVFYSLASHPESFFDFEKSQQSMHIRQIMVITSRWIDLMQVMYILNMPCIFQHSLAFLLYTRAVHIIGYCYYEKIKIKMWQKEKRRK